MPIFGITDYTALSAAIYPFIVTLSLSLVNFGLSTWINSFSTIKLKFSQKKDIFLFSFDEGIGSNVKYNFRTSSDYLYLNLYVNGKTKNLMKTDIIVDFPKSVSIQKTDNSPAFITSDGKNEHRIKISLSKILNPHLQKARYAKRIELMLQKEDSEFFGETETRIRCKSKMVGIDLEHNEIEFNEGEK